MNNHTFVSAKQARRAGGIRRLGLLVVLIYLCVRLARQDTTQAHADLGASGQVTQNEISFGADAAPAGRERIGAFALIADGSFEATPATSPWIETDTTGCIPWIGDWSSITEVTAFDGDQYFWAGGACEGANSNSASQSLDVPADNARLSFRYYAQRVVADSAANDDYAYVEIDGYQVWRLEMTQANNTSGWVEAQLDLGAYAGASVTLTFGARNGPDSGFGNVYFDYVGWEAAPGSETVPLSLQRRATQFLEELRGSAMAPDWATASIDAPVRPLYRPDVDGVAYYEFPVLYFDGYDSQPAGFIVVAAGDHDYPIAHWSAAGYPPTWELEDIALESSEQAVTFYKLDTQGYAAENEYGDLVAMVGELPPKVIGMDPGWLENPPEETEMIYTPDGDTGSVEMDGPAPPASFEVTDWDSWDQLKTEYGDSLGVMLEALHRNARPAWEAETEIDENGVVLYKGDVHRMALLEEHGRITFSGAGVDLIDYAVENGPETLPVLVITVLDSVPGELLPVDVDVAYDSGASETIRLLIVEPHSRLFLPAVQGGSQPPRLQSRALAATNTPDCPAGWNCVWAGDYWDQRWYDQIPAYCLGDYYDTCLSGCGATAWAMLFGWADNRAAAGDPLWAPHWGIYRADGQYGANAVAPFTQAPGCLQDGVKNMTREIRGYLGTWCNPFGVSAATFPQDMIQATRYLWWRDTMRVTTHYNYAGIIPTWLGGGFASQENHAFRSINRGTPAIIGTGTLKHYAVAFGYAWRVVESCFLGTWPCQTTVVAYFHVNDGCGARQNADGSWWLCRNWVPAQTWFVGEIYP